MEPC